MKDGKTRPCFCADLPRPRKRLTELMMKALKEGGGGGEQEVRKQWGFRFLRSPVEVISDHDGKRVAGICLDINKIEVRTSLDL